MRPVSGAAAESGQAAATFRAALAELAAGREQVSALRPELHFEEVPPPRTLAPHATAFAVTVLAGGDELASGRFVLLYDPAGQESWAGPLRVIVYIQADLDPEIAADPLIGQVGWDWLTEALAQTGGYEAPSGTVTRVVTEGFGAKAGEPPVTGFELRASWSPVPPAADAAAGTLGLADHVIAWCGALCAASGLPPLAAGVTALRAPAARSRP
jgi:Protein of unknown function (DUF3000)